MALLGEFFTYAIVGAIAGFFAGLLGIGGGLIISPLLILVFSGLLGFSDEHVAHMAIATASGIIALTAPISAATHAHQKNIDWYLARLLSGGAMAGALIGATLAGYAPAALLKAILSVFILLNAASFIGGRKRPPPAAVSEDARRISPYQLLPVAGLIGALSALLGIGGGALTVPYLCRRQVALQRAIGTSAFVGFPLAVAAASGYIIAGSQVAGLPPGSWGYVYLPALLGTAVFSVVAAYYGARMTGRLPTVLLRRIFAAMMLSVAAYLLGTLLGVL